ncbi:Adenylate and Guanylate cyclase catalytic domain-containing protein [Enhydrobacter aerosaccus]|uniref:Adenylate and Guanylate cyclase catalytic domain-containing protein n=1 Tax=Enhydrobacter aerosaccus TaxID=225324 RepID=A0A1T4NN01_9HYPH|nr:adenylate/guanylate cyclase domain-containing protein [Enhydrobacter aerosaccus]SJZ80649.1 Adenylate and Guanylate cyclase catalytic domain-containing protein [Enhydrobacter aerosaccus]
MVLDDQTRILLFRIVRLILIAAGAGAIYAYAAGSDADIALGITRGALSGALIGAMISTLDAFVLQAPGSRLAGASFLLNTSVRSLIYLGVFLVGIAAAQLLTAQSLASIEISRDDILFCFAATFVISFLFEVNSLLGQSVLLAFITGRYHRPRVEQRLFLMIDMKDSTAAAERLGEVAFHRLLNRFVNDLAGPIVRFDGQIHKYVGDELIATWPLARGVKDARCLRACFAVIGRLQELGPAYRHEFGAPVQVRAALHCGPVVVGEMGSVKKEIALIGDTMNTTARIVDACRDSGQPVLISAVLLDKLALPTGLIAQPLGPIELRGKGQAVELFSLAKRATP